MHKALQTVQVIVNGDTIPLTEGELVELTDAQADALVPLGYVEVAKAEKPKVETPESKTQEPEKR